MIQRSTLLTATLCALTAAAVPSSAQAWTSTRTTASTSSGSTSYSSYRASYLPIASEIEPAAACTDPPAAPLFATLLDFADYALAPGGDFENAAAGWTLKNAKVASGNETLGILPGANSLLLGATQYRGGDIEATTPEFCVTQDHPTFRYLYKAASQSSWSAGLTVEIKYRTTADLATTYTETSTSGLRPSTLWSASPISPLATKIPAAQFQHGVLVRLSFKAPSSVASDGGIRIDNLLIDPYRRS